ncbi:transcriptional repressor, partial [Streptomyces goshikiensis]
MGQDRHEEEPVATAPGETAPVRGRSTRQRAAVAAALDEVDEFRSAQELHDMLKHRGDSVGLTTVYRTLQSRGGPRGGAGGGVPGGASLAPPRRPRGGPPPPRTTPRRAAARG